MAKQSLTMRLDRDVIRKAKKIIGESETTATVEIALQNMINNRKAIELLRKATGKSHWKGLKVCHAVTT